MTIKDILNLKGSISFHYKTEMRDWIGEVKLSVFDDVWETKKRLYCISPPDERFEDMDKAIKRFKEIALSEDNIALKQTIWNAQNLDKDPDEIDVDELEIEVRAIKISDHYEKYFI